MADDNIPAFARSGASVAAGEIIDSEGGDSMKVPDRFPTGCRFGERSEGGFFVEFPEGSWFKLSDDGKSLDPRPGLESRGPMSEWFDRSEAEFLAAAMKS